MRLFAILSDVHANFPALEATLQDATRVAQQLGLAAAELLCLGDVVGYGPHPLPCLAWAANLAPGCCLQGNHDREASAPLFEPPLSDRQHWPMMLWTRAKLDQRARELIQAWPEVSTPAALHPFTLFHSALDIPDRYIDNAPAALASLQRLPEPSAYGICGHTHLQGYFTAQANGLVHMALTTPTIHAALEAAPSQGITLVPLDHWHSCPAERTLFNPGSVGQPRTHGLLASWGVRFDYRACYMLLREDAGHWSFQFRRVTYAVQAVCNDLAALRWPQLTQQPDLPHDFPGAAALYQDIEAIETLLAQQVQRLGRHLCR
jgi:diadenosine tetraphosphatase ApaH/serine/threonine PP2A family protein phosphatase